MKHGLRQAILTTFAVFSMLILGACKSGSSAFSDILGPSNGGTGTASIAITSFSPGSSSIAIKEDAVQQFLISAVGQGTLVYEWTLDGVKIGADAPAITLDAADLAVGNRALKVKVRDSAGEISQEWAVKINGPPVVNSSTPTISTVLLRRLTSVEYSVSATDPNSDSLTYVWKLDGQEGVLTSTTSSQSWTPDTVDVGNHTVSVDIYDGPASDVGTYKVTRSWTTRVNSFSEACNRLENQSQTNKSCVYVGLPGVGDGSNPLTSPSSFLLRPAALEVTSEGNVFIADDDSHVVWFWNRYSAPSTTVLGVVVPQNTMKIVAGAGLGSSGNSASSKALRVFFNNPHGLLWDGTHLYISDASNNRVVRVDSNGDLTTVNTANCNSPRGLAKFGNQLYIACYSSHRIRLVDTDTLAGSDFAGTGSAGDPTSTAEATFTDATQGRLRGPYGVAVDAFGDLFVSEYDGCRVRAYNINTVTPKQIFGGSWTISQNRQRIVLGTSGGPNCGTYTEGEAVNLSGATDARVRQLRQIRFAPSGELLLSGDNMFRIVALNFASGSSSLFGTSIDGYSIKAIAGIGTNGYLGEGQAATSTRLAQNYAAAIEPTSGDLIIADRDNRRLRRVNASDDKAALVAGNGSVRNNTNSGQGNLEVGLEKQNQPRGIVMDSVTGQLFIADSVNHRIRVVSRFGEVSQAVGTGTLGSGGEENEAPTNSTMNQPRGLVLTHSTATFGGHLVWADSQNRRVRIWNRESVQRTLFGVTVEAGMVATIGGDGTAGNATSGSALQSAFNEPSGVAFDGSSLYVADRNNHCIKKIDSSGELSAVAGTCGTSGNTNGAVGVARMTNPEGLAYYSSGGHTGLVIAATGNGRVRFLRFAGPSSLLFGTSISVGDSNVVACNGTFHTEGVGASLTPCSGVYDVASFGSKFCYANSNYHNARCVDSTGAVTTVMGAVQGIDDSTQLFFPKLPMAAADYDSTATYPNVASQNGVTAFFLPSPLVSAADAPALGQEMGGLLHPRSIYMHDANTVYVSDYIGLIRKVKLP